MRTTKRVKITLEELNSFCKIKRYTEQTQQIIRMLLIDNFKQVDVVNILELSPQRVNNIKNDFLKNYFYSSKYIYFEGAIRKKEISKLSYFRESCDLLLIKTDSEKK